LRNEVLGLRSPKLVLANRRATTFEARTDARPAWLTNAFPKELGPTVRIYKRLKIDEPRRSGHEILGEILYEDKFGNLMTNIPFSMFPRSRRPKSKPGVVLNLDRIRLDKFALSAGREDRPFFLVNSQGLIEIAVREGSAAAALGAKPGDPVRIRFRS
jgi:S-adenosylmethionine hydrolase